MSEKVLGKLMSFEIDGNEIDIKSHGFSEDPVIIDSTDTGTPGDIEESVIGVYTRSLSLEANLKDSGGDLVLGKKMKLTFNSIDYPLTDLEYSYVYGEHDFSDGSTEETSTEFEPTFAKVDLNFDYWMRDTDASIPKNAPNTATLTLATGITVGCTLRVDSKSIAGEVKGGQKISAKGTLSGTITETGFPSNIPLATKKPVKLIFKTGTGANKEIAGNATIFGRVVKGSRNGEYTLSLSLKFSGVTEEHQYSAT